MVCNKFFASLLAFAGAVLFLGSCDQETTRVDTKPQTVLILSQGRDAANNLQFQIESFIRDDMVIFEQGKIPPKKMQEFWDKINVRWGFRSKPNDNNSAPPIYWLQKNKNYKDPEDTAKYPLEASEENKANFVPKELPAALLQEEEIGIELVSMVSSSGFEKLAHIDLPPNFKSEVLQVTNIYGQIQNKTAIDANRPQGLAVTAASVYIVHKGSGQIFHSYSDTDGKYKISVRFYDEFLLVSLKDGLQSVAQTFTIRKANGISEISGKDILMSELPAGTSFTNNQLYDITAGTLSRARSDGLDVSGSTVSAGGQSFLPHTNLLFYNISQKKLYFLRSGARGKFDLNLPMAAELLDSDSSDVQFFANIYGYIFAKGSFILGRDGSINSQLKLVELLPDPNFDSEPSLSWGPRTSGGATGFVAVDDNRKETESVNFKFTAGAAVTVQMDLRLFDPLSVVASPRIVWKINEQIQTGKSTAYESFALSTRGLHTITAEVAGAQAIDTISRKFNLDASFSKAPSDPVVRVEYTVQNGKIDNTSEDDNGNEVVAIIQSDSMSVSMKVSALNPGTGSDTGLTNRWYVDGARKNPSDTANPVFALQPGRSEIKLAVISADGTTTVIKTFVVNSPTLARRPLVVFGAGTSSGVLPPDSNLGTPSNPLLYPVAGAADKFKIKMLPLVTDPVGGNLNYVWRIRPSDSVYRSGSEESFALAPGTYTISVAVTNDEGGFATALRSYRIATGVTLPAGYKAQWTSKSSGGAGNIPTGDRRITLGYDGNQMAVNLDADLRGASGALSSNLEWYINGELQSGKTSTHENFRFAGNSSAVVTHAAIVIGRDSKGVPILLQRVFTLKPALATPQFTAATSSDTTITVSWSGAVANAAAYIIYYSSSDGFVIDGTTAKVTVANGAATSGIITGLTRDTRYYFRVMATAVSGGSYSDSAASSQQSKVAVNNRPPSISGKLRASRINPTPGLIRYTLSSHKSDFDLRNSFLAIVDDPDDDNITVYYQSSRHKNWVRTTVKYAWGKTYAVLTAGFIFKTIANTWVKVKVVDAHGVATIKTATYDNPTFH